jgi:hypothetical protein
MIYQDVLFHIIAENRTDRNNLIDIIRFQTDKTIWLFNSDTIAENSGYPLDYRGMKIGTNMYPNFVADGSTYQWKKCYMRNAIVAETESLNPYLHQGVVRTTMEVVMGDT